MSIDDRALEALIEQSDDLHVTRCVATVEPTSELTELGQERRRETVDLDEVPRVPVARETVRDLPFGKGALAAVGFGAASARADGGAGVRRSERRRADVADRGVDREPRDRDLRRCTHARLHRWRRRERCREGVRDEDAGAAPGSRRGVQRGGDATRRQGADEARSRAPRRGEQGEAGPHRPGAGRRVGDRARNREPRRPTSPTPER